MQNSLHLAAATNEQLTSTYDVRPTAQKSVLLNPTWGSSFKVLQAKGQFHMCLDLANPGSLARQTPGLNAAEICLGKPSQQLESARRWSGSWPCMMP